MRRAVALAALLLLGAGCAGPDAAVVFAAASLTEVTDQLVDADAVTPRPRVNLAGSQVLAAQLLAGADADVFLSADPVQVDRVVAAGLVVGDPVVFAHNRLVVAVAAGNPHAVEGLADLARNDLTVVLPAPEVPAGAYARAALDAAGITVDAASLEPDVRAALSRVALGEADATVVYATDTATSEAVAAVTVDTDVRATYVAAVLDDGDGARAVLAWLTGTAGRAALADLGFEVP